jgi:hypothetical protein
MVVGFGQTQISLETNHFDDKTTLPVVVDGVTDGSVTVIDQVRLVLTVSLR